MEQNQIKVEIRTETGKNAARRLRTQGFIPGVVYGKGIDPVPVTLNPKELASALSGVSGQNTILTVKGGGSIDGNLVIVADLLRDAIKRNLRHVDFHKLNMEEKIRVHVPVKLVGTSIGVKEGGMLDFPTHSLDIECLPTNIPGSINVDISNLTIGHSIHVSELELPEGVKVLLDSRASIVSVLGKLKEETPAS